MPCQPAGKGWETARKTLELCHSPDSLCRESPSQLERQRVGNPHPHTRNKGEEQWRDIPVPAAAHPSASQACKPSSRASQVPETPAALWAASKTSSVPLLEHPRRHKAAARRGLTAGLDRAGGTLPLAGCHIQAVTLLVLLWQLPPTPAAPHCPLPACSGERGENGKTIAVAFPRHLKTRR